MEENTPKEMPMAETTVNVVETPVNTPEAPTKKSSLPSWLGYVLFFLLGSLITLLTVYLLETSGTTSLFSQSSSSDTEVPEEDSQSETETEIKETEDETATATTTQYAGTYFSAELPTDWTIIEYTDNSGSDMIMGGTTYSGLVGMKVFNENNIEMFYLKAVDGIGGIAGCDTVYQFTDSDQAYIDHGNDWTLATGVVPSTVVDLTSSNYTEYTTLGWEVRRVGADLYRNMNSNLPGFNPACGIDVHFNVTNLAYNRVISGGTTQGNTYYMEISATAVASQLEQLDNVLASLIVN